MRRALLESENLYLTVVQYKDRGAQNDSKGLPQKRPDMICPVCREPVRPVAEDSMNATPHWAHHRDSPFCPIKDAGSAAYEILPPRDVDPKAGETLRASLFLNWRSHWKFVRSIIDRPDIKTFAGFIKTAEEKSFWQLRHLEEWHIPYIFLAACEHPPPRVEHSRRVEWLRFIFDGRCRAISEFWMYAKPEFQFICLIYRNPADGTSPGPDQFIDFKPISIDPVWFRREFAERIHPFAERIMDELFQQIGWDPNKDHNNRI